MVFVQLSNPHLLPTSICSSYPSASKLASLSSAYSTHTTLPTAAGKLSKYKPNHLSLTLHQPAASRHSLNFLARYKGPPVGLLAGPCLPFCLGPTSPQKWPRVTGYSGKCLLPNLQMFSFDLSTSADLLLQKFSRRCLVGTLARLVKKPSAQKMSKK